MLSKWLVPTTKQIEMAAINDIVFNDKSEKRDVPDQIESENNEIEEDPKETVDKLL